MRVIRCLVACLFVFGLAGAAAADHHEGLLEEVRAIGDALSKAMLEDDFEFMLGMYAEDAISLPNFGPRMQGVEQFRLQHEQMSASGMKIHSFESDPTEAWQAGDQVIEIGNFEISLSMPGVPQPIEDKGKYMTVYQRDDEGELKIIAEIWNTDINPMEMGGGPMPEPEKGGEEGSEGDG